MSRLNAGSRSWLLAGLLVLTAQFPTAQVQRASKQTMNAQFLNPTGLSKPNGYTQVVVAPPGKLVYVAGQVPVNAGGEVVGRAISARRSLR